MDITKDSYLLKYYLDKLGGHSSVSFFENPK